MKKIIFVILIILLLTIMLILNKNNNIEEKPKESFYIEEYKERYLSYRKEHNNLTKEKILINVNIGLDKPFYSNTRETTLLNELTLVNKYNYLKKDYVPKNLKRIDNTTLVDYVSKSFNDMKEEMKKSNLNLMAISGYRSYDYQNKLYKRYELYDGKEKADTYSARAGFSEHQTGLAVDVSNGKVPYTQFEETDEYKWMIDNSYKFGFILRYPKEKEHITGYIFESWHYRYVGISVSTHIKKHNITYEEYYAKYIEPNL